MQEVKLVEWLNKETFEVKSLPEGAVIKGIGWVKIPDDAEFAVSKGGVIEFRKGDKYFNDDGKWYQGCWEKEDFPMGDWEVVWERKTPQAVKQQTPEEIVKEQLAESLGEIWKENMTMPNMFIEQRVEVFKKLLQGVKFQYRYNDTGQWHNLTKKGFEHLTKQNVVFREKPQKITIDGIEMDKDTAIKYIEKHY